jgi:glyceraldehyde 3-phosphate dehydrogenase
MAATRIAVAGDGRIAHSVLAALRGADGLQLVAINAAGAPRAPAALRDAGGAGVALSRVRDARRLPWKRHAIDIVLDCSGRDARAHLAAGARKVLSCAPAGTAADATVVYGVNHGALRDTHRAVDSACRATHCIAPVARVLHEALGISNAMLTAVHSRRHDGDGDDDFALPMRTGAAEHLHRVLPELDHCFDETEPMRMPGVHASLIGMVFVAQRATSVDEVNALMQCAAFGPYAGILRYGDTPLTTALADRDTRSSVFEAGWTQVSGRVVKVCAGYRGDHGFAHRLVDTARAMAHA